MLRFGGGSRILPISISRCAFKQYTGHTGRAKLTMNAFLKDAKDWLQTGPNKASIVIGNEACDLDSMTSAILFAWFRSSNNLDLPSSTRYVPLLNIPREDIRLRPEFKALLEICHVDIENLITLTDLPDSNVLPAEHTRWILVDHNKLDSKLASTYSNHIQGCIDHHKEEDSVPKDNESELRVIETCGSCTSLVLRELAPQLLDTEIDLGKESTYNSDVLKFGLASILVDTNNLQGLDKTEKVDTDMALQLDRILQRGSADWDRNTFFDTITAAKKNLNGLPFPDVLRKDYKQWREKETNLGISSVVKNLDFVDSLVKKDEINTTNAEQYAAQASKFMAERGLDIWAVMTAFVEKDSEGQSFQRQLRIHWRDLQMEEVVSDFEKKCGKELHLELIDNGKQSSDVGVGWISWRQNEVAASRKQVAPMLRNIMKQYQSEQD